MLCGQLSQLHSEPCCTLSPEATSLCPSDNHCGDGGGPRRDHLVPPRSMHTCVLLAVRIECGIWRGDLMI